MNFAEKQKVSIVVPVYNVENYIAECIISVASQDYNNIEIIAVNDGSTDASLSILKQLQANFSNLIVVSQENKGQSVARNKGLEIASGDYVLFVDSDDWIDRNTVSMCMDKIISCNVDMVFFAGKAFVDGLADDLVSKYNYERHPSLVNRVMSSHEFFYRSVDLGNYIVQPCLCLFSKKMVKDVLFFPDILHEDNLFTTEILLNNSHANVFCLSSMLFNRRLRPESIMTQKKQQRHIDGYLKVAEVLSKNKLLKEKSNVGRALNVFLADVIYYALRDALNISNGVVSFEIRKKAIGFFVTTRFRYLKLKRILTCLFPELLWFNSGVFRN